MIEMQAVNVEAVEIRGARALDPIRVFWCDAAELGRGSVTITCFGAAWTAYFGGMCGQTIRQFFASCDVAYLVNKLGITPFLKCRKRDDEYLARIIGAVQEYLAAEDNGREVNRG